MGRRDAPGGAALRAEHRLARRRPAGGRRAAGRRADALATIERGLIRARRLDDRTDVDRVTAVVIRAPAGARVRFERTLLRAGGARGVSRRRARPLSRRGPAGRPCYSFAVDSVADRLRADDRAAVAKLDAGERVALALRLGARDLDAFRLAHDPPLAPAEAARRLARRRQAGRRPSRAMQELIG
jgi:hypothetical protein